MTGNVYIGNRGGIPVVTTTPIVGTSDVRFILPNHIFRYLGHRGKFVLNLTEAIPTGTTGTLPVLFEVNGNTLPLDNPTGAGLTASDILTTLTFDIYFDKYANALRVLSVIA